MDLQALVHDRRTWLVAGGLGAAVGAVVLIRKRSSSSSNASAANTGADMPTYSAANPAGSIDTTGTDIANWLGSYSENLDAQNAQFRTDLLAELGKLPGDAPATTPTSGLHSPASFTAPANSNLYDYAHQVETQTGIKDFFNQLPRANMKWGSPSKWGTDPKYGNIPYYTDPVSVTVIGA